MKTHLNKIDYSIGVLINQLFNRIQNWQEILLTQLSMVSMVHVVSAYLNLDIIVPIKNNY